MPRPFVTSGMVFPGQFVTGASSRAQRQKSVTPLPSRDHPANEPTAGSGHRDQVDADGERPPTARPPVSGRRARPALGVVVGQDAPPAGAPAAVDQAPDPPVMLD